MKRFAKKAMAAGVMAAMVANVMSVMPLSSISAADAVKYEFEDGVISGSAISVVEDADASGGKCVYMKDAGDTLTVKVDVETAGMYDLNVCYKADSNKTQKLKVNGVQQSDITFPESSGFEVNAVTAVKLEAGENTIEIESFWGWTQFDYMTVTSKTFREVSGTSELCDPQATSEAKSLMKYLSSVYGKGMLSGQQEFYGVSREDEFKFIEELTDGELPAIKGFDFGETCPLFYWDAGTSKRLISWVKDNNGIATASWHINVPVDMDKYEVGATLPWDQTTYKVWKDGTNNTVPATNFVTANVLVEGTKEHDYFLLAVENLAKCLKEAQDANVPILFRPFHEAEGNGGADGAGSWFWWSKEGTEVYVQLYKYLYDLLTNQYGLHNLIWEFNSYTYSDESKLWYPGDDYVDLIGYDKYNATNWQTGVTAPNESAISGIFYDLVDMYDNSKMIALMENDTVPSLANIAEEHAYWLYFMPWYGEHLMDSRYNNPETLKETYKSDWVITLDELPKDLYTNGGSTGTTAETKPGQTTTTTTKKPVTTTTTSPGIYDPIPATIKESNGNYDISFDRAIGDKVYLEFKADSSVKYANGCVGISVTSDELLGYDTDYWVSYKWEISKSGAISVDLSKPYEITYNDGKDKVVDKDAIAKIVAEAQKQKNAMVQVWWANDSEGESIATSNVSLVNAWILGDPGVVTTTSSETTTTTVTEVTTTITEETTTTKNSVEIDPNIVYGDVNVDGKINLTDVIYLNKTIAKSYSPSSDGLKAADVDLSGEINLDDTLHLLKYLINVVSLPNN